MIGREKEEKQLKKLNNSKKAQLVAVYGRRRVGKTYLINQTFKGRIAFSHAGLSPLDNSKKGMLSAQLEHFYYSLIRQDLNSLKPSKRNLCQRDPSSFALYFLSNSMSAVQISRGISM